MKIGKDILIKVFVGLVVIGFMLETVAIGVLGGSRNSPQQKIYEGTITTELTIENYKPYLILSDLNESVKEELRSDERVDGVADTSSGVMVALKDSASIIEIYEELRKKGILGEGKVVLSFPSNFTVSTEDGEMTIEGGSFETDIEPIYEIGEKLPVAILVQITDGRITAVGTFTVLSMEKMINATASVESFTGTTSSNEVILYNYVVKIQSEVYTIEQPYTKLVSEKEYEIGDRLNVEILVEISGQQITSIKEMKVLES